MFTLDELEKGVKLSGTEVKCQFGKNKMISFSERVLPHVSSVSKLFWLENAKYWELKDECSDEQFVLFTNLIIKDILIHKGIISL